MFFGLLTILPLEIPLVQARATAQVHLSDSGIGIKKEDLGRVFQPFAAIQKRGYVKGTGLGLGLTKGLVEAHGGRIWAESQ
jgi:signal transduction histidine kinase